MINKSKVLFFGHELKRTYSNALESAFDVYVTNDPKVLSAWSNPGPAAVVTNSEEALTVISTLRKRGYSGVIVVILDPVALNESLIQECLRARRVALISKPIASKELAVLVNKVVRVSFDPLAVSISLN